MAITSQFAVEFRKDGAIHDANSVSAVLDGLAGLTDLVVIAHGWNNDKADAASLYDRFVASAEQVAATGIVNGVQQRQVGVVRAYWPSKKFADSDLIPGGGAASVSEATSASQAALVRLLDELKRDPIRLGGSEVDATTRVHLERAQSLVPALSSSADARREFVQSIRAVLNPGENHPEDGSAEFFTSDPEELFKGLSGQVKFVRGSSAGGATSMTAGGAANFLTDAAEGVTAAARRIANYATYYQMKTRAGTVGRTGVALMIARIRERRPELPIHLVGHSFGGRLVAATAATLEPGSSPVTMLLLQAAFSHNGFARKFDGKNDGAFRTVIDERRVSGPIVITHTKNDSAVGVAYPLASRIANDTAAALGDENDPYGGMGRNGAQRTQEATSGVLCDLDGRYDFTADGVINLRADKFIMDHSDVTGHQVTYAFWHGLVAGSHSVVSS
jgi:hypothetical protein